MPWCGFWGSPSLLIKALCYRKQGRFSTGFASLRRGLASLSSLAQVEGTSQFQWKTSVSPRPHLWALRGWAEGGSTSRGLVPDPVPLWGGGTSLGEEGADWVPLEGNEYGAGMSRSPSNLRVSPPRSSGSRPGSASSPGLPCGDRAGGGRGHRRGEGPLGSRPGDFPLTNRSPSGSAPRRDGTDCRPLLEPKGSRSPSRGGTPK